MKKLLFFLSGAALSGAVLVLLWAMPVGCRTNHLIVAGGTGPAASKLNVAIFFHDQKVWSGEPGIGERVDVFMTSNEGNIAVVIDGREAMKGGYIFPFDGRDNVIGIVDGGVFFTSVDRGWLELARDHIGCIGVR